MAAGLTKSEQPLGFSDSVISPVQHHGTELQVTHGYFVLHNAPIKEEKREGKNKTKQTTKHSSKKMKGKNQTLTNWLVTQVRPSKVF